ncbi:hypothetical protein Sjap_018870 [Stephania japonica]|uniref:DUF7795 domain-containing protein n=1 Tax=Stephania japonica TaxID=461633 RepID=A0AAP0I8W2_9MAGN
MESLLGSSKEARRIFSDFMTRNPLDKRSKLVGDVIKANETQRMTAYLKDGCLTVPDGEDAELVLLKKHEAFDYVAMMGIIYNMLKQDYTMEEKIVSSLKLSSQLEQLDSYCKMWSLRPYINDDIMHQAWRFV